MMQRAFKAKKRIISAIALLGLLLAVIATQQPVSAATGSFSLASNKSAVVQGNTFVVTVRVSVDAPSTVVKATLTYDQSQVSYQSMTFNGTPYNAPLPDTSAGSGKVVIARYATYPDFPSGNNLVLAQVTFKALANSGSASIGIDQSQSELYVVVDNASSQVLSSVSGTSVSLQPVPTTPPATSPTSPTKTGSSGGGTSKPSSTSGGSGSSSGTTAASQPVADPDFAEATATANEFQASQPTTGTVPAPGKSQYGASVTLWQRVSKSIRTYLPLMVVLGLVAITTWFAVKRIRERPFGVTAHTTPSSPSSGIGGGMIVGGPSGQAHVKRPDDN